MTKSILALFALLALAANANAALDTSFVACQDGNPQWKITFSLDLAQNKVTSVGPNGTDTYISAQPIAAITQADRSFLSSEAMVDSSQIISGYKATIIDHEHGDKPVPQYFLNLKGGGQVSVYGAMVIAEPCGK